LVRQAHAQNGAACILDPEPLAQFPEDSGDALLDRIASALGVPLK
jgi:hypothetical protein